MARGSASWHARGMSEIVNLNRARKAKARAASRAQAAENRVRFGQTKAEKAVDAAERARALGVLDAAKLTEG